MYIVGIGVPGVPLGWSGFLKDLYFSSHHAAIIRYHNNNEGPSYN